jgi:hypothetical protein
VNVPKTNCKWDDGGVGGRYDRVAADGKTPGTMFWWGATPGISNAILGFNAYYRIGESGSWTKISGEP